ncbi:MAG: sigma-70 family RNA polymerase sigma factor [Candidatus Poribacteria bacterium]|nr:sigma-70 family RNA polymerase sigma factor [Candidatus Poribacteria bacterium]
MRSDDIALIQRILAGDESAFASLVKKYEKRIHALAWQKTRDFHIAEDIVQETFLQVDRKLETLEDPTQFSRWLYQIADRLCIAWFRKNRIQTEPLEETDTSRIETEAYSRYVAAEHAKTSAEAQRDLVKKLLAKLKERDREIVTLHYFEEMTSSEIGTFLGVSENTIKSQLRRARQRLKKYEFMIQEALDITIEEGPRSQKQLKGEISMTKEVRDESKIEANAEETQGQIADLQNQINAITDELDASLASKRNEALETLRRVPYGAERPISWGYVGGYRTSPGKMTGRVAFWGDNIDNFLSKAPDADIVNLASLFTNANVIAVLRQLVEGKRSVSDLANGCDLPESEVEKAVETLMDATLVARTEDDLIEPKNDAVSFFLNFVSMTIVHLGHIKPEN